MSPDPEERLLVQAAQRDPSRFADLYEQSFYRVYAYIARRVGDRHSVEDLTAQVFSEALAGIGRFEWQGVPFVAWLLRIASRAVADHWKRMGRESDALSPQPDPFSPDEIERHALLFQLVDRLPEAQFRVIHSASWSRRASAKSLGNCSAARAPSNNCSSAPLKMSGLKWRALMPDRALDELLDEAIDAILARAPIEADRPQLDALVRIAAALPAMPAEDFQSRLRTELQRRALMTPIAAAPVREGLRTVTPYITVTDGASLIEFLKRTFAAEELLRAPSPAGFHAEVRIGDSILMIGSGESVRGRERIGAFHVYVPDCDAAYRRALEAGATSMGEPANRPYGERSGFVKDFAGNHWYIATRVGPHFAPEGLGTVLPFLLPPNARALIDFLKQAFAAREMAVFEESGRVVHGAVRIGDAVLEMGEPREPVEFLASRFFVYVEDCDLAYGRAVAAGASSLQEPADQPYGHRAALVEDPFGYQWIPASLLKA